MGDIVIKLDKVAAWWTQQGPGQAATTTTQARSLSTIAKLLTKARPRVLTATSCMSQSLNIIVVAIAGHGMSRRLVKRCTPCWIGTLHPSSRRASQADVHLNSTCISIRRASQFDVHLKPTCISIQRASQFNVHLQSP
ncbi:hypothetical protein PMIN06_005792 [Paraphaeosphaeria minitans]